MIGMGVAGWFILIKSTRPSRAPRTTNHHQPLWQTKQHSTARSFLWMPIPSGTTLCPCVLAERHQCYFLASETWNEARHQAKSEGASLPSQRARMRRLMDGNSQIEKENGVPIQLLCLESWPRSKSNKAMGEASLSTLDQHNELDRKCWGWPHGWKGRGVAILAKSVKLASNLQTQPWQHVAPKNFNVWKLWHGLKQLAAQLARWAAEASLRSWSCRSRWPKQPAGPYTGTHAHTHTQLQAACRLKALPRECSWLLSAPNWKAWELWQLPQPAFPFPGPRRATSLA